jgi:hypothetical protein
MVLTSKPDIEIDAALPTEEVAEKITLLLLLMQWREAENNLY